MPFKTILLPADRQVDRRRDIKERPLVARYQRVHSTRCVVSFSFTCEPQRRDRSAATGIINQQGEQKYFEQITGSNRSTPVKVAPILDFMRQLFTKKTVFLVLSAWTVMVVVS